MKDRDSGKRPPAAETGKPSTPASPGGSTPPAAAPTPDEKRSGRVQFDERGQAVWEWAVQTGMFDRDASTSRIRKLTEDVPIELSLEDTPPARGQPAQPPAKPGAPAGTKPAADAARPPSGNPYERAAPKPVERGRESSGGDPYSRGPAKRPESLTFNPYERTPKDPKSGGPKR